MADHPPRPTKGFAAPGIVDVTNSDPGATPVGPQSTSAAAWAMTDLSERLAKGQSLLLAQAKSGDPRGVLVVLHGTDTSVKQGVTKHVLGGQKPAGPNDPKEYWKYNFYDVTERAHRDSYQRSYRDAITACRSDDALYIIPADRRWYRTWAVAVLLTDRLPDMDLRFPGWTFDPQHERERILETRDHIGSTPGAARSR